MTHWQNNVQEDENMLHNIQPQDRIVGLGKPKKHKNPHKGITNQMPQKNYNIPNIQESSKQNFNQPIHENFNSQHLSTGQANRSHMSTNFPRDRHIPDFPHKEGTILPKEPEKKEE